ncbi:MAG: hypothetical protein ACOX8A_08600 [Thermacetogeniaceae bacterium]|jgi:hypothetical protein
MAAANVPERVKIRLWGKAAGRCEYDGCNEPLWLDSLTKAQFNVAYIAHIFADTPTGPRGDPALSEELKADINNLMLLCDKHHRLIDIEENLAKEEIPLGIPGKVKTLKPTARMISNMLDTIRVQRVRVEGQI